MISNSYNKYVPTALFFFLMFFSLSAAAWSGPTYGIHSLNGNYVLSLEGSFTSPPPPFTGTPLQFEAAQIGRLTFDGAGQAWGEATLTFHHPAVCGENTYRAARQLYRRPGWSPGHQCRGVSSRCKWRTGAGDD